MTNSEHTEQLLADAPGIADPAFLDWLIGVSGRLSEIRGPAFYHEIEVDNAEAQAAVEGANRVLAFGQDFLKQLRGG